MKGVNTLAFLAIACFLPVNSQPNVTTYSVYFSPPDGALITYFTTTLVIPRVPPDATSNGNYQEVTYGLIPTSFSQALAHYIRNDENGPPSTEWNFVPAYCCNTEQILANDSLRAWPGDQITSVFSGQGDGGWRTSWSNDPGPTFPNATVIGFNGSSTLGPVSLVGPPMTQVVFQIEVKGTNTWDFGHVSFTNIQIDAETTNTSWCEYEASNLASNLGASSLDGIGQVNLTVVGNSTTCNISSLVFLAPLGQNSSTTAPSSQTTTSVSTKSTSSSTRSAIGSPSASRKSEVGKYEANFGNLFLVIFTILSILC